ncbi:MAG: hypothetical protein NZL96_00455 [Patescibacteria group bacterium]|nr:hypothetical protein [Patescibacteria group bacterium]
MRFVVFWLMVLVGLLMIGFVLLNLTRNIVGQENQLDSKIIPSPTLSKEEKKKIEDLKERVALQVDELIKENNRAFAGFVEELSDKKIKIKSQNNKDLEILVDENLTKFYKIERNSKREIPQTQLKKGDYLVVLGIADDRAIQANFVYVDQFFVVDSGRVVEIDKQNFNLRVITSDKTTYTLSIETTTRQQLLNIKNLRLERGGFSRIIVGDYIHFVCQPEPAKKEDNLCRALRTLIIPQEYFIN